MSDSFELYTADCVGNMANCFYSNRVEVKDSDSMREAIKKDHVCAEYKGNYRSVKNFVRSNVCVMDCDNDHSENEDDWITEDKLHDLMPEISYVIVYSRNHMKEKDGKAARPRFHVYFFISEITDAESYRKLKVAIYREYPFFDGQALDSARFIFGCDTDGVIWHQGFMYIDEVIDVSAKPNTSSSNEYLRTIPEGQRNSTLSRFAARGLKRYGVSSLFGKAVSAPSSSYTYAGGGAGWFAGEQAEYGNSAAGGSSYIGNMPTFTYKGTRYRSITKSGQNEGRGYGYFRYIRPCREDEATY